MSVQLLAPRWLYRDGSFQAGQALVIADNGWIKAVGPRTELESAHPQAEVHELPQRALMPGTISAHSHCFQVLLRGAGDHPASFRDWVKRYLYPLVERLDAESLEAAALICFAQMAKAGVTSVGEFHYVHNDPEYSPRATDMAKLVIGAARRVGLRIAFIRTIYDVQEVRGQGRFAESPADAVRRTRKVADLYGDDDFVSVMPAPHSLHGASQEAVVAGVELARELGTRWHIHLAEQRHDTSFAKQLYLASPLEALDSWGLLDDQATIVHGIWLSEREQELMAERDVALVSNPTTNMALGDGIAPLTKLMARGVRVALGTDMNQTTNVFQEMRLAELLQRVESLRMGRLAAPAGGTPDPARVLDLGTRHGAHALGLDTGELTPGRWADLIALDLQDPSLLPAAVTGGVDLVSAVTTSIVAETAVTDSWVGGRQIMAERQLLGVDDAELAERCERAQRSLTRA